MLILLSAALFCFGVLLIGLGVAVWLLGVVIRIAIRFCQPGLLLVNAALGLPCRAATAFWHVGAPSRKFLACSSKKIL